MARWNVPVTSTLKHRPSLTQKRELCLGRGRRLSKIGWLFSLNVQGKVSGVILHLMKSVLKEMVRGIVQTQGTNVKSQNFRFGYYYQY